MMKLSRETQSRLHTRRMAAVHPKPGRVTSTDPEWLKSTTSPSIRWKSVPDSSIPNLVLLGRRELFCASYFPRPMFYAVSSCSCSIVCCYLRGFNKAKTILSKIIPGCADLLWALSILAFHTASHSFIYLKAKALDNCFPCIVRISLNIDSYIRTTTASYENIIFSKSAACARGWYGRWRLPRRYSACRLSQLPTHCNLIIPSPTSSSEVRLCSLQKHRHKHNASLPTRHLPTPRHRHRLPNATNRHRLLRSPSARRHRPKIGQRPHLPQIFPPPGPRHSQPSLLQYPRLQPESRGA